MGSRRGGKLFFKISVIGKTFTNRFAKSEVNFATSSEYSTVKLTEIHSKIENKNREIFVSSHLQVGLNWQKSILHQLLTSHPCT